MPDKTPRKRAVTIADLMANPISGTTKNVAATTFVARRTPINAGIQQRQQSTAMQEKVHKIAEKAAMPVTANTYKKIKIKDARKILAASNQPINPNRDLMTGSYEADNIRDIIAAAQAQGVDPYTALAVSLQETGLGREDDNLGHVLYDKHVGTFDNIPSKYNPDAYQYVSVLKSKLGEGTKKYKDNEALQLQAYNGYGMIGTNTEADYYDGQNKTFYGVDVTTPISLKKNPLYGKTIIDLRDNVLKTNPEVVNMVNSYDPDRYDYSETEASADKLQWFNELGTNVKDFIQDSKSMKKAFGGMSSDTMSAGVGGLAEIAKILLNPPLHYSRQPIVNTDVTRTVASPYGYGGCADCDEERAEYGKGGWIKKAAASIKRRGTKGKCTPMTKPGCTGRARALAKTFKKIARNRKKKEMGGTTTPSYGTRYATKVAEQFAYGGRKKYQHAGYVDDKNPIKPYVIKNPDLAAYVAQQDALRTQMMGLQGAIGNTAYGDTPRFQPAVALTPAQIGLNKTKNMIVKQNTEDYNKKVIAERKATRGYKKPAGAPTRESTAKAAEGIVEGTRFFPNSVGGIGQMVDDYGLTGLARMVASPFQAPYEAQQTNSYRPYGLAALNLGLLGLGAVGRGGAELEAGTDAATTNSLFGWQPKIKYSKHPYADITDADGYTFGDTRPVSSPLAEVLGAAPSRGYYANQTDAYLKGELMDAMPYKDYDIETAWRVWNARKVMEKFNAVNAPATSFSGRARPRIPVVANPNNPSTSIYNFLQADPLNSFGISPHLRGTGRVPVIPEQPLPPEAYFRMGGLTKSKAREILHDGTAHGHPLTDKQRRYMGYMASRKYPMGGDVPIEVEGNEVVEEPGGLPVQMSGPSHEQGGIDMDVPEGTKIFSDRLAVDGLSMKDRKVGREKRMAKLSKLLDKHPSSWLLKATIGRTAEADAMEEEQDLAVQDYANEVYTPPQDREEQPQEGFAYGGRKKYLIGGEEDGKPILYRPYGFLTDTDAGAGAGVTTPPTPAASTAKVGLDRYTPFYNTGVPDYQPYGFLEGLPAGNDISNANKPPVEPSTSRFTLGDIVGAAGTAFGAASSLANTKNAFAATPPNVNRLQGIGQRNIDLARQAQGYAAGSLATDLNDITTGFNTDVASNRNSAQGVGTLRALNTVAGINRNTARSRSRAANAELMSKLMGQEGQATLVQDIYQAQGQTASDTETKQDIDAYYSNLGQDYTGISEGIQTIGKNMNISKENADTEDLIGMLNEHGVKIVRGKDGRLHRVNG